MAAWSTASQPRASAADEIDDRLPAQGEPRVYPGDRLAKRQLEIERAVHDDGQQDDRDRDGADVIDGERRRSRGTADARVRQADERRSRGEVRGIDERGAYREAAEQHVADEHRERRHDRGECPAPIENGEQHHADHIGGETVAGERDAVPAGECRDEDQQRARERKILAYGHRALGEGDERRAETDESGERNGRTNEECPPHKAVAQGRRRGAACQARLSFTP